jgi:hypothetical protein
MARELDGEVPRVSCQELGNLAELLGRLLGTPPDGTRAVAARAVADKKAHRTAGHIEQRKVHRTEHELAERGVFRPGGSRVGPGRERLLPAPQSA